MGDVLIADCRRWIDRESGVSMKRNRDDEITYTVCKEGIASLMEDCGKESDMYLQGIAASLRTPMLSYLCNRRSCNYIGLGFV